MGGWCGGWCGGVVWGGGGGRMLELPVAFVFNESAMRHSYRLSGGEI